ncbi:cytochrome c biogenesis protein CcsA [Coriobacteriia bacterium Es71-Z0120]|uniref:cytochrome c biogenesis protein n=1 Tax=Parvivirga hydrogeniphila TaxID=2939460 RepID=UPI002260F66C|nr:cytochrome c biogenesis protein CcsA [Parvivirga hydrogeniphila]MCL4079182.1 cytochrome c biogenesis protein CcsA [Parvivirga hydrogeniphila]
MNALEATTFWIAIALYAVGAVAIIAALSFKKPALQTAALAATGAGLAAHSVAIVARWVAAGHFPYIEDYENVLVGAFVMVLAYFVVALRFRGTALAGVLILPVTLVTCGYGITQAGPAGPVTPPYQSGWLVVHVTFAWITYAAYSTVAGLAAVHLIRRRAERRGQPDGLPPWLPSAERIEELTLPLVAFGFLNNAVMIASGSIWAYRLWGSYWSWDPVETWSLLTWLAYGFYLHAKVTLKWSADRLAWLALFCLFGVMMVFWGVQLVPTSYHLFRNIGSGMPRLSRPQ